MRNPRRTWIVGTVVVALLLCVGGWFAVISPKRASAAELDDQAASLEQQNSVLQVKVAKLRDQFNRIDDLRAELAALQAKMPVDGTVPALVRQLDSLADEAGVTVASIVVNQAEEVAAASGEKQKELESLDATVRGDAEAGAEGEEGASAPTDTEPVPSAAGKQASTTEVVVGFPTSITFSGSFDEATDYVMALQEAMDRYFLVSGLEATSLVAGDEDAPGAAVEDGDVTYVITGSFFLYTDFKSALLAELGEVYELPAPDAGRNPFAREIAVAES